MASLPTAAHSYNCQKKKASAARIGLNNERCTSADMTKASHMTRHVESSVCTLHWNPATENLE